MLWDDFISKEIPKVSYKQLYMYLRVYNFILHVTSSKEIVIQKMCYKQRTLQVYNSMLKK